MGSPENPYKVRLDVSNFGPIAEASVELRPLTVFVGPSNTGKTYLATLTYALHKFFSGATFFAEVSAETGISVNRRNYLPPLLFWGSFNRNERVSSEELALLENWVNLNEGRVSEGESLLLPDGVASIVRRHLQPTYAWDESISGELGRCFGTADSKWLVRHGNTSGARFSLQCESVDVADQPKPLAMYFGIGEGGFWSGGSVPNSIRLSLHSSFVSKLARRSKLVQSLSTEGDVLSSLSHAFVSDFVGSVGSTMFSPLSQPAHYLPADRTGVMNAHRWVVASTISSASIASLRSNASVPSLSGVLADFLLQLMTVGKGESRGPKNLEDDLGATIESNVLSGEIRTDQSDPTYPVFSYLPEGWDKELPLLNSSSMVSELAPVVLFLRYVVKPGEVLIIEEPESHLHPSMQVEFMRQLAAVVNSGVRIMITTHSEWILDELANLVRLSDLPPEKRTPRLKNEPALDPRDVGVWLFERGEGDDGSHVKELPLDLNEGWVQVRIRRHRAAHLQPVGGHP